MRHLEFAKVNKEEKQKRKEQHLESVKQIQETILKGYNFSVEERNKVFNPETDHPEDAPELTKEGYSFAKNRFFVARNFFDKTHVEWTQHMFKFQEHRKQYYREKVLY